LKEADEREREESLAELLGGAPKKPTSSPTAAGGAAAKRPSVSSIVPAKARPPLVETKTPLEEDMQALDPGNANAHIVNPSLLTYHIHMYDMYGMY
jgi:hypothetical protein